ncbi:MAG: B12-binding domain-containing radical SAM protein [Candidatus Odinarchaeia archaeon]
MHKIVLTADKTLMTEYGGASFLGFILCAPRRLLPNFFVDHIICPKPRTLNGEVYAPPYSLRKVEASLVHYGFKREDIGFIPPFNLKKLVSYDTEIVGVNTVDPMGRAPVSWTLRHLLGGGKPATQIAFEKLMWELKQLKERYGFKIIVGGPGSWQLTDKEAEFFGIDVRFYGQAEITFPKIVDDLLKGNPVPKVVRGVPPSLNDVFPILGPARSGFVEITEGCGRGCRFCAPTQKLWKSIPIDVIKHEVKLNVLAGEKNVYLLSEDWIRYGAKGFKELNQHALLKLLRTLRGIPNVDKIVSTHVNFSSVKLAGSKLLEELNYYMGITSKEPWVGPQIGLETGSIKLISKYMRGKVLPFKPEEWRDVVIEACQILSDVYWYPCITLITGLPDENDDDIMKTLELLDELKTAKAWFFPLFFIPIGTSALSNEEFFKAYLMNDARWELVTKSWKLSAAFASKYINKVTSGANSSLLKIFLNKLFSRLSDEVTKLINEIENKPQLMFNKLKDVDLTKPNKLLVKAMVSVIAK